jgi:precorrin-3B methylase
MEIEQDEFEKNQFVEQVPKLIADADSTQYKVILKALEGKSMAVEGPPGTGKSQTITNIIGGLIVKNKKVLFAADKLAALEVVKQRLNHKNLGDYILELHSPTKSKKAFHEDLKDRITKQKKRFFKFCWTMKFQYVIS